MNLGMRHLRENPVMSYHTEPSPIQFQEKILPDEPIESHRVTAELNIIVELPLNLYGQLLAYTRAVDFEISGLGSASYKDGVYRINELCLVEQKGGQAHTKLDPTSISKLMVQRIKQKNMAPLNVWWHSHVNLGTFWSRTDEDTAKELARNKPFMLGLVGVQNGEIRCRVDLGQPYPLSFDTVPLIVTGYKENMELVTEPQLKAAKLEAKKKVKFDDIIIKQYRGRTYPIEDLYMVNL